MKTLKERIEQEKGKEVFSAAGQKLIYAGMISANPTRVVLPSIVFIEKLDKVVRKSLDMNSSYFNFFYFFAHP